MAANICLRVLKFSHVVSKRAETSLSWQHVTSDELFVTVDGDGSDQGLSMQIIRRHETLVCYGYIPS
jgi:hypothetical protein